MSGERRSLFDRFADQVEETVSSATFFAFCVVLVLVWGPTLLVPGMSVDTWQLIINTLTTIITFLLVALLTNTQARFEKRTDEKLDELLAFLRALDGREHGYELAYNNLLNLRGGGYGTVAETPSDEGPA